MRKIYAHGTDARYRYQKCRCKDCSRAAVARCLSDRERRLARAAVDPSVIPHGTETGYVNWACKCTPCADAAREARNLRDSLRRLVRA